MNIKKLLSSAIVGFCCLNLISVSASAHSGDVFEGTYIGKTKADFVLRINSSAQNDIFTYSNVYKYGCDWNKYSSNVQLGVTMAGPSVPTISNQVNVDGSTELPEMGKNFAAALTTPYDSNGKPCGANENWSICSIDINVSDTALDYYSSCENGIAAARKVFVHEVGHVLKLSHPEKNSYPLGHYYSGYPNAIMNQGFPGSKDYISGTITNHDKLCLIEKWGA